MRAHGVAENTIGYSSCFWRGQALPLDQAWLANGVAENKWRGRQTHWMLELFLAGPPYALRPDLHVQNLSKKVGLNTN